MINCRLTTLFVVVFVGYFLPAEAQPLKKEPDEKQLSCGQKVLVDNHTCPEDQILEVTGSCLRTPAPIDSMRTQKGTQYHCVRRKRE